MQNINKKNGEKLKGFRIQNGYAQSHVAEIIGRSTRSLRNYESGQQAIPDTLVDFLNGQYNLKLQKSKKVNKVSSNKKSKERSILEALYTLLSEVTRSLKEILNV